MRDMEKSEEREVVNDGNGKETGFHISFLSRPLKIFTSLRLTIGLLITLALVSIIGTMVQQGRAPEEYIREYGDLIYSLFLWSGITDMYHAWWFIMLLAILGLNLIICTIDRLPSKWWSVHRHRVDVPLRFVENLPHRAVIGGVMTRPAEAQAKVLDLLNAKRYKYEVYDSPGEITVMAYKGKWGRFGSDITHLGIICILFGGILGSIWGFKDFVSINEGEVEAIPNTDFQVKVNRFWIDYYDTGQVKQYYSDLSILEEGREVLNKTIYVNEPLKYKGIRLYQSSYGLSWSKISEVNLSLFDQRSKKILEGPFKVRWNEKVTVPLTDYAVKLVGFVSDFAFGKKNRVVYTKSAEHNNPAVRLEVYKNDKAMTALWVFLNHPGFTPVFGKSERYNLAMVNYQGIQYTGLQITKDPGVDIVWLGSSLMFMGFILAFFVFYKRLWVKIKGGTDGIDVNVGGLINKNKIIFEREFNTLIDSLRDGLQKE